MDTPLGLNFDVTLIGFHGAGDHGIHVHAHANCSDAGQGAGPHYDPAMTNSHQGPVGSGHLGDLPRITADHSGLVMQDLIAPRLHLSDLVGRAIIVHEHGDNYSDMPPNGGGGARIGCGVIVDQKKV